MSAITTHVLDVARGRPAAGMVVVLERHNQYGEWTELGRGQTDLDGRLRTLLPEGAPLDAGRYRLTFDTQQYFDIQAIVSLYPSVSIVIQTTPGQAHYHVPLLLSPFGYTTYRGS